MKSILSYFVAFILLTANIIASEEVLFYDNFEDYQTSTFPNQWVLKWNGAGNQYQVVVNNIYHSASQSMQLKSSRNWATLMYKTLSSQPEITYVEAWMKTPKDLSPNGGAGTLQLYNPSEGTWGTCYGNINIDGSTGKFYFMNNTTYYRESNIELGGYDFDTWYHLKFKYSHSTKLITIWINNDIVIEDESITIGQNGKGFTTLALSSGGWGENIFYFDDVKVWTEDDTDKIPPTAMCKSINIELDKNGEAIITAEDVDDGSYDESGIKSLAISKSTFDYKDIGDNIVTLIVTDNFDNVSSCNAIVKVIDNIAPSISLSTNNSTLWPPNNKMIPINVSVDVSDNCPGATYVLSSITSNENISDDVSNADFNTADNSFDLRAQRNGNGNGRVYTITYTVTDASGNISYAEVSVNVPHDQRRISLMSSDEENLLMFYPNPVQDNLTISFNSTVPRNIQITIVDLQGNIIHRYSSIMSSSLDNTIDFTKFSPGEYFVKVLLDNVPYYQKIIKK